MTPISPQGKPSFPFPTHNVPEIIAWQPPAMDPIIEKGILYRGTRLVLYGLYKALKSMMAINMAFDIATGTPWLGFKTKLSTVLYVQFEIPHALLRTRIEKYAVANKVFPQNLIFTSPHYLKLDKDYSMSIIKEFLNFYRPDVVIVDPIYRTLSGDISSSYDMSRFMDNMDLLANDYQFAIILVHHERKEQYNAEGQALRHGSQDMMGSSYLPNWLDTAVQIDRPNPQGLDVHISFTAMRHAEEEFEDIRVRFNRDSLGARVLGGIPASPNTSFIS